jgi:hypothetical protein
VAPVQSGQKIREIPSQQVSQACWCRIPAMPEAIHRRSKFVAGPGQKLESLPEE